MQAMNPRVALILFLLLMVSLSLGQASQTKEFALPPLKPGVVVEQVAKYSTAEKAGLSEGDVILRWSRDVSSGEILSPFDLAFIEIEQAPRGVVALGGFHGSESKVWQLEQDTWGIQARPNFPDVLLTSYHDGQALAAAGKLSEAESRWRAIAAQAKGSDLTARTWLLFRIAQVQAEAREWTKADEAYSEAVGIRSIVGPLVAAQLLRAWAKTFEERSLWAEAEQHYQHAMGEPVDSNRESLSRALDLENLGNLAYKQGHLAMALQYHHQVLNIRVKLAPNSLAVASSLNNLGRVEDDRSDLVNAEDHSKQALRIGEKVAPGSFTVSTSLRNLGIIAMDRGELDKADEYQQRSLEIRQKLAPDSLDTAASFTSLGSIAFERDELARAEDYYHRGLIIRQRLAAGSTDVAASLHGLGLVSKKRGDFTKAEEHLGEALAIQRRLAPGSFDVAFILYGVGAVALERGNVAKAEECYREALAISEKLAPDGLDVAAGFTNLGAVAIDRGDLINAEEYKRKALAILQRLAPDGLEVARTYFSLGLLAEERSNWVKAAQYHTLGLEIRQRVAPESQQHSDSLRHLGTIFLQQGNLISAEKQCQRALEIVEKTAPLGSETAEALQCLAAVAQKRDDLPGAEQWQRRALAIWDKLAPGSDSQAESLAALASIAKESGRLGEAERFFQLAVEALETQTAKLGGTESVRAGFRAKYQNYYQDYMSLLVHRGKIGLAFQELERSRARTLLEMLATAHVDIHHGADPNLVQKERSLRENITARTDRRMRMLSDQHREEQIAEVDREISELRDEYQAVEAQLRAASPDYAALTQPEPLTTDQVQKLLDGDTVLLEYSLGEKQSYVFAVTRDSVVVRELSSRAEIERVARNVYDSITARNRSIKNETIAQRQARWSRADSDYPKIAGQLTKMILDPVMEEIQNKRLVVVSDGALQYVPFAALPAPEADSQAALPLMVQHEIVNLPSASILAVLRRQEKDRQPPAKSVAVFADPVFTSRDSRVGPGVTQRSGDNRSASMARATTFSSSSSSSDDLLTRSVRDVGLKLSRLPFTRREAEAIFSLVPSGQTMKALDFNATRKAATASALSQYRIVHFATHGLLDSQQPELSGLVLSLVESHGKPQSGFLTLEDIYNLNMPAQLVVLSACETGLGKEIKGEGLIGLTRGFMYAGASRVMASLWSVNDVATAELMGKFYQGVLRQGLPPASALRNAQRELWQHTRWKSPYYWAAFQLQGDWR